MMIDGGFCCSRGMCLLPLSGSRLYQLKFPQNVVKGSHPRMRGKGQTGLRRASQDLLPKFV